MTCKLISLHYRNHISAYQILCLCGIYLCNSFSSPYHTKRHGVVQVQSLIEDRPVLRYYDKNGFDEQLTLDDEIVEAVAEMFHTDQVEWDREIPSNDFVALSFGKTKTRKGRIQFSGDFDQIDDFFKVSNQNTRFLASWFAIVFELHNLKLTKEHKRLRNRAARKEIDKMTFVAEAIGLEIQANVKARKFFNRVFISWAEENEIEHEFEKIEKVYSEWESKDIKKFVKDYPDFFSVKYFGALFESIRSNRGVTK